MARHTLLLVALLGMYESQGAARWDEQPAGVPAPAPSSQLLPPERTVHTNVIVSDHDPQVRIELPQSVRYVGADRWVLYDIADCELHAFVDAGATKTVTHLYWVQFEAYVPTRPELKHKYESVRHENLGGSDFFVDTWIETSDSKTEPGSDTEHIRALVNGRGYRLPAAMMSVRLVTLDAALRKELMFIYSEDVAASGFTADDLRPGGKAYDRWPAIADGPIERAKSRIKVH